MQPWAGRAPLDGDGVRSRKITVDPPTRVERCGASATRAEAVAAAAARHSSAAAVAAVEARLHICHATTCTNARIAPAPANCIREPASSLHLLALNVSSVAHDGTVDDGTSDPARERPRREYA